MNGIPFIYIHAGLVCNQVHRIHYMHECFNLAHVSLLKTSQNYVLPRMKPTFQMYSLRRAKGNYKRSLIQFEA